MTTTREMTEKHGNMHLQIYRHVSSSNHLNTFILVHYDELIYMWNCNVLLLCWWWIIYFFLFFFYFLYPLSWELPVVQRFARCPSISQQSFTKAHWPFLLKQILQTKWSWHIGPDFLFIFILCYRYKNIAVMIEFPAFKSLDSFKVNRLWTMIVNGSRMR